MRSSTCAELCASFLQGQQIREGNGVCLIDPHGDLADQAMKLIPKSLSRKVVWINPDASYVPGLNILGYKTAKERELGIESFQSMMKALAGTAWGDETARVLSNATDAVVEHYDPPRQSPSSASWPTTRSGKKY